MPDGADKKNKKKPAETEPASQAGDPDAADAADAPDAASHAGGSGRNGFRLPLIGLVLVAAAFFGGREIYNRVNFVYSDDSRIEADLITVSSRVAGWVTRLEVSEGSGISTGQVLLIIDSRESKLRVSELDARISGLDAEAQQLAAERRLVDDQTASLYSSERSRLEAARIAVSSLQPQLKLARREFQRAQSLFERKVFSRRQLDQAETASQRIERQNRMAVAERDAAEAKLKEAGAERARLGVLDGGIAILKYRKAELLAKRAYQNLDISDRTIKSPVDGVVDKTFAKTGEYVTPGQRLVLVHDPNKIWIEANIKETQIRELKVGQNVEVSVDAYPDMEFRGRVLTIGNATTSEFALLPSPNPSGNFTKITQRVAVRIAIEQKDGLLRPGMMVEINVDIRNP